MFKRILKLLLGIISFPVCIAASTSFYGQLSRIRISSFDNQRYFIFGVIAYLVLHIASLKPQYFYIFGHEVMHMLATWFSGGRVTAFNVSSKGGKVTATKSNLFIALVPYFFPFYTIMAAGAYLTLTHFFKIGFSYGLFLFLIGFTLSYHILMTVDFLKVQQTDFLHAGYVFSICLIYVINLVVIGSILSLLFSEVILSEFLGEIYYSSRDIYTAIFRQLFA